jgi:hypothetical protein
MASPPFSASLAAPPRSDLVSRRPVSGLLRYDWRGSQEQILIPGSEPRLQQKRIAIPLKGLVSPHWRKDVAWSNVKN